MENRLQRRLISSVSDFFIKVLLCDFGEVADNARVERACAECRWVSEIGAEHSIEPIDRLICSDGKLEVDVSQTERANVSVFVSVVDLRAGRDSCEHGCDASLGAKLEEAFCCRKPFRARTVVGIAIVHSHQPEYVFRSDSSCESELKVLDGTLGSFAGVCREEDVVKAVAEKVVGPAVGRLVINVGVSVDPNGGGVCGRVEAERDVGERDALAENKRCAVVCRDAFNVVDDLTTAGIDTVVCVNTYGRMC